MKESQMFEMNRKLQIAQNKYNSKKKKYVDILRKMIKKGGIEINNNREYIDDLIDEYAEKLMRI